MPLSTIPPDPEPSEDQYKEFLPLLSAASSPLMRVACAKFIWRYEARKREPDRFLVPFANWLPAGEYEAYLQSGVWLTIRQRVLRAAKHECSCCRARATDVHHRDYRPKVLRGEDISTLVAICRKCHDRIEKVKAKETWNKAEELLEALVTDKENDVVRGPT
jgi:hypothetical protein